MNKIKIAPSVLSADLLKLKDQIESIEKNEAELIHLDIMDGHFVPNITFGPVIVSTLKRITDLPLDVHLMIMNADNYIPQFARAGADYITVHQEAGPHLHRSIQLIKEQGVKAGVALNPATDLSTIEPMLPDLDLVLLMTVNPGFGGQTFIPLVLDKISKLSELKKKNNYNFEIEVDGGINMDTVPDVVRAGAEVLVAGNAIFGNEDPGKACRQLKSIAGRTLEKS
ncbi:MAG: ribulose-phosphate 3-epimerase [Calditrichia bacterium]|nr:ribulose-phosphate 3-epimerase [Calditrichia bacterium]